MKKKKKSIQEISYVLLLLIGMIIIFRWYSTQNKERIAEQNKNYAADSAQITVVHINEGLENALNLIKTYTYFAGKSLNEPTVSLQLLKEIEENSLFDNVRFTDLDGNNFASDGQKSDATERDYYLNGIRGESGISAIFDSYLTGETMLGFYTPVCYNGEIIGVLRGVYLAEEYLKDMLATEYFGEKADVYFCMPDGRIIASSDDEIYEGNLLERLTENGIIDEKTALDAEKVFENGGEGAFICASGSKTDNICVMYLPENEFVLVQTFPKDITQSMIKDANRVGILLEGILIGLLVIYIAILIIRSKREKKILERENREMGYIIDGVNTLFSRFVMVDFETDTYQYLEGTKPEGNELAVSGSYKDLQNYMKDLLIEEKDQQEFLALLDKEAVIEALAEQNDLRFEWYILRDGHAEWEHMNLICLERNGKRAAKVLVIRQNITEVKEKELRIQAEMSLADLRERQYRIAVTSNAIAAFDFNLTKDLIEADIVHEIDGQKVSALEMVGMKAPCSVSEWFERWKRFVSEESMEDYCTIVNPEYLKQCFEQGDAEVDVEYWSYDSSEQKICVRQSFLMTRDYATNDIMVMVVTKEITGSVRKQMEQTQALQDALIQAQRANRAKTTFLSNMSHDIRTPMNAIIGFATIAVDYIDNREKVGDCLQKVLSSSNHLLSLIDDILDMSRIESGKIQIKEQECNLSELMHTLMNIIQPQVKAKQLELFIDTFEVVNEDVIADPLKLNQILINLLSNAVKYTPAGGTISFRIMQKTAVHQGYGDYIFIVKDNGIGMSPEFVGHIFEPFEREASTTRSGIQGTGLGMAITKNIVDMMNGTISVESEVGKGSTFTVELTMKLQDAEKNAGQIKELEGLRILVVDGDVNTCTSVSKMLEQMGMRSEWTTSGKEAVYRAKTAYDEGDAYHTYLVDWQMPETNGIETAIEIRSVTGDDTPVIILMAYDWSDIEEEAKSAGVTAFCVKPLFLSNLKSALLAANGLIEKETKAREWSQDNFYGKRVLLVDDIELNREIAEVILTGAGFTVETAPDGTDAVAMVEQSEENYYDVILMDVQMPIMDGYEATRTIRALQRQDIKTLPIIAMTANALEEDKEAALKNGMNAHVSKPLDINVFIAVLRQFLN